MPLFGNLMRTGLSMFSPGGVKNIVRKGLELWYKGDKTQQPLGEEKVKNGNFLLGPNLVTNGDFSSGDTSGWVNTGGKAIITNENGHIRVQNSTEELAHWNQKMIRQLITYETGKQYKLSFKVRANYTGSDFFVRAKYNSSVNGRINNLEGGNGDYITIDTNWTEHVFYFTAGASYIDISFGDGNWHETINNSLANQYFEIDNVSVRQTNPNDSWSITGDTVIKDGTALIDNGLLYQAGIMIKDRKYRLEFDVSNLNLDGGYVRIQDNTPSASSPYYLITSNGHHTVDFTWGAAHTEFQIAADTPSSAVLSNITLKEISNSIRDYSLKGNDGVLHSGIALSFSGDDLIDLGSRSMPSNTETTFAVWVNPVLASGSGVDYEYAIITYGKTTVWFKSNNSISFYNNISDSATTISIPDLSNKWHRLVITVTNQDIINVYIDGELAGTAVAESVISTSADTSYIGSYGADRHLNGNLSDFQIYDKAWTPSDVKYDYNNIDKDVFEDKGRAEVISNNELVANGSWVIHNSATNWSINDVNNVYTSDGGTGSIKNTYAAAEIVQYKWYRASFEILEVSSGKIKLFSGPGAEYSVFGSTKGVHTHVFQALGTNLYLYSNAFNGSVTNVSLKEVTTQVCDISLLDCVGLYRFNEGVGISVIDSSPVLGNIVNVNSDFSTTGTLLSGVGHESGWLIASPAYAGTAYISNGQLTLAARASDSMIGFVYATNGSSTSFLNTGSVYQLSYTIDEIVGSLVMDFFSDEGGWKNLTSDQMTVGTHTLVFRAAGSNFAIRQWTFGSIVKLSNIAVREILPTSIYNEDLNGTSLTPSSELVANNSFTADSDWDKGTGWTITGGKAVGAAGTTSNLTTLANVVENYTWYDVSVDVLSASGSGAELSVYINQGLNRVQFFTQANTGNITSSTVISFKVYSRWDATQTTSAGAANFKDIAILKNSLASCEIASISVKKSVWQYTQPYIPQYAALSYSKKLMFNKLDEKVDLGSNVTFAADNEAFTLSFFYQHTSDNVGEAYILQKDASNYIALNQLSNKIYWKLGGNFIGDDAGDFIDIDDLEDFKTHYITITRASGNNPVVKVYINGTLQKTVSASSNQDGVIEYRYIGYNPTATNLSETFFIDEISTFNKEFSSKEVQELFNNGQILDARDHSAYLSDVELVSNNDFTDNTLNTSGTSTTEWTRYQAGASTASISDGVATLSIDGSNSNVLIHQADVFESGKIYKISLVAKASADFSITFRESQGALANNTPSTASIATVPLTTEYQTFEYTFTATGNQGDIFIGRNSGDAAGANQTVTVDSISIKKIQTVGYWRNNGLQSWDDLSPNGNDATVTPHEDSLCLYLQESTIKGKDVYGLPMNRVKEKGLQIDNLSYIHTGNTFQDVYRNSFTIQMWLKPQDGNPSSVQYIYGAQDSQSTVAIYLSTSGDIVSRFQAGTSSSVVETKPQTAPFSNGLSNWVHVTFVYTEGSNTEIYINGIDYVVDGATPPESSFNAVTFVDNTIVGGVGSNTKVINSHTSILTYKNQYEGKIDEVKLYSTALTAAQVKQNYDAEKINHSNTSVWSDDFDSSFI